jgi:hypothetical protein
MIFIAARDWSIFVIKELLQTIARAFDDGLRILILELHLLIFMLISPYLYALLISISELQTIIFINVMQ